MATRDELMKALRAADAAGAADDARRIAAMIKNLPANAPAAPSYAEQVQQQFDAMPMWQKPLQAGADLIRQGGDALSMGYSTKLAESLGMDGARQNVEDARIRSGAAGNTAEIGAGMLPLMMLPQVALPAKAGPVAKAGFTGLMGALEGAGVGGLQAGADDEDVLQGQQDGAISGILGQAAGGAIAKGVNAITAPFKRSTRTTVPQLRDQKDAAYRRVTDAGVEYTPSAIDRMVQGMERNVRNRGADHTRHPNVFSGGRAVDDMLQNDRSLSQVDRARQIITRDVVKTPNDPAQQGLGMDMVSHMDDFLNRAGPRDVTVRSGSPDEGIEALLEARSLNSRMRKLEDLDESVVKAERKSARSLNTSEDTTLKANIDSILGSEKKRAGYTPDEIDKMDEVVRGTPGQNFLRQAGRLAPGGGLSLGAGGVGFGIGASLGGGPAGAALAALPMAAGWGAKKLSERSTKKSIDELLDLVASGGDAARLRRPKTIDERSQSALARMLMLQGIKD